jgi:hypothetical protein
MAREHQKQFLYGLSQKQTAFRNWITRVNIKRSLKGLLHRGPPCAVIRCLELL